jgi:hypothetical protein
MPNAPHTTNAVDQIQYPRLVSISIAANGSNRVPGQWGSPTATRELAQKIDFQITTTTHWNDNRCRTIPEIVSIE